MVNDEKIKLQNPKALVVGGSIAGLSCAHALLRAGWDVVVIDKSSGPRIDNPTGAGLSIKPSSCRIVDSWLGDSESFINISTPLTIAQSQATDAERNSWVLSRTESFNIMTTHWSDLHFLLRSALPPEIFLWGHFFQSFSISDDKASVTVKVQALETGDIVEITGDLLVAADGSMSSIRRSFLPDHKRRYAGYCAWRGVQIYSETEDSDTIRGIRKAYPDLGNGLYCEVSADSHCVFYEVPGKRINWVWCVNQPEPDIKGNTVTIKADTDVIKLMRLEAEKTWCPELARLILETKEPFLNAIHDSDPLDRIVWDNVVLVGDAAHPSTPHLARSTNAAILDAAVLGKCLEKNRGLQNLYDALSEYQSVRLPVVSIQVLQSRHNGKIRQSLGRTMGGCFDPRNASEAIRQVMQQSDFPVSDDIPDILDLKAEAPVIKLPQGP